MRVALSVLFLILSNITFSQDAAYEEVLPYDTNHSNMPSIVDSWPMYKGGVKEIERHILSNLEHSKKFKDNTIHGTVSLTYVVGEDGVVCDVKIIESVDPKLDFEASRVILSMDKWKPASQRGKPVKVKFYQRITF